MNHKAQLSIQDFQTKACLGKQVQLKWWASDHYLQALLLANYGFWLKAEFGLLYIFSVLET